MNGIKVRPATAAEAGRIADFNRARALETEGEALHEPTALAGVVALIGHPERGFYLIAEVDSMPAGCLLVTYEWSDWRNADWWWIQSVYVAPEHRRQGVYAALYAHVLAGAKADPAVCGLRLYVERDNATAQRTYESLGMVDAGYRMYEAPTKP